MSQSPEFDRETKEVSRNFAQKTVNNRPYKGDIDPIHNGIDKAFSLNPEVKIGNWEGKLFQLDRSSGLLRLRKGCKYHLGELITLVVDGYMLNDSHLSNQEIAKKAIGFYITRRLKDFIVGLNLPDTFFDSTFCNTFNRVEEEIIPEKINPELPLIIEWSIAHYLNISTVSGYTNNRSKMSVELKKVIDGVKKMSEDLEELKMRESYLYEGCQRLINSIPEGPAKKIFLSLQRKDLRSIAPFYKYDAGSGKFLSIPVQEIRNKTGLSDEALRTRKCRGRKALGSAFFNNILPMLKNWASIRPSLTLTQDIETGEKFIKSYITVFQFIDRRLNVDENGLKELINDGLMMEKVLFSQTLSEFMGFIDKCNEMLKRNPIRRISERRRAIL